jgi:hypothetical protein
MPSPAVLGNLSSIHPVAAALRVDG